MLGVFLLVSKNRQTEVTGGYYLGPTEAGDSLILRLRPPESLEPVKGYLSGARTSGVIQGAWDHDHVLGGLISRSAEGYNTNATLRAELRSGSLVGVCLEESQRSAFSLPLVAVEQSRSHSLNFRVGRYGCNRKAIVSYPEIRGHFQSGATRLNALIKSEAEKEIGAFFEDFWSVLRDSVRLPGASYNWSLESTYHLHSLSPKLASLQGQHYSFTGGAHGNTLYTRAFCFEAHFFLMRSRESDGLVARRSI